MHTNNMTSLITCRQYPLPPFADCTLRLGIERTVTSGQTLAQHSKGRTIVLGVFSPFSHQGGRVEEVDMLGLSPCNYDEQRGVRGDNCEPTHLSLFLSLALSDKN